MTARKFVYCAAVLLALTILSCSPNKNGKSMIEKNLYGTLQDGREVYQYTLTNGTGSSVKIINFGATVTTLEVPDRTGKIEDIVLGYDSLEGWVKDKNYLGVIVGRYGNRIDKGQITLEGKKIQLTVNDGTNHLHGGALGLQKRLWDAKVVNDSALELSYSSPDGEEGYPGNVRVTVTYAWTKDNELRIDYKGTTDRITIFNPTHHSYFNLTGSPANTILDQLLTIEADTITPVDNRLIPTGKYTDVANTPMDFRTPAAIGSRINDSYEQLQYGKGYDHNWVLRNFNGKVRKIAELYEPKSGRLMTMFTDQPGLQFYSGNFLDGSIVGKKNIPYQFRTGLCLESQCYPDTPNKPHFPTAVLKPGGPYHQTTVYQFSTR